MTLGRGGGGVTNPLKKISTFRYWYMQCVSESADYCPGFFWLHYGLFCEEKFVNIFFKLKC